MAECYCHNRGAYVLKQRECVECEHLTKDKSCTYEEDGPYD
jgi:hypothetical protein